MKLSLTLGPTFDSLPTDVLSHIALDTVSVSFGVPPPRELMAIRSLLLTGRIVHQKLSLMHNPHLYANIFRLMFDVVAVRRRMGAEAVVSSALASELKHRLEALKRFKTDLDAAECDEGPSDANTADLARMFLMMTENDGKNGRQLADLVDLSRVPRLLFVYASRIGPLPRERALNSCLALIAAIMWVSSDGTLVNEDPHRHAAILDLLQPLVLNGSCMDISSFSPGTLANCDPVANITYFGFSCTFHLSSLAPFARLCTVGRYNAVNHTQRTRSGGSCMLSISKSSTRFDEDWPRYLTVSSPLLADDQMNSRASHAYTPGSFEGLWEGEWFVSCAHKHISCTINPTPAIFMCAQPMQCHLREYVSSCAEDSVFLVEREDGINGDALTRAWFPEKVEFDETATSLQIYDPTKARWLCYKPRASLAESSGDMYETEAVFDTILVGNTELAHGETQGEYVFHGRVRDDGTIALVRKPADPDMDYLGTWVFHGQVHGRKDFVGNWRVTSADYAPAGKGWFHLSKDGSDTISD